MVIARGEEGWEGREVSKGAKYMAMEGNQTLGHEHAIEYIDVEL